MSVLVPFSAPVVRGKFLRRYKRFFVDVELEDGSVAVAHTANTGAMTGLLEVGAPVLLTRHEHKGRAYPLELEALRLCSGWVSLNTGAANTFAAAVIRAGHLEELRGYDDIRHEVRAHPRAKSRLDLLLSRGHKPVALRAQKPRDQCYVEVKSVTLRDGDRALFPDAVTERGRKHLDALARLTKRHRAAMLYVVKRADCSRFAPARTIDPEYSRALVRATRAGVEVYCVAMDVSEEGLAYVGRLPVSL